MSAPLRATCLTAGIVLTTLLGPSANADRPSVGPSADSDGFAVAMTSQSDPTATNSDTISAVNTICRATGLKSKIFSYAGTKDKRGVKEQISVFPGAQSSLYT